MEAAVAITITEVRRLMATVVMLASDSPMPSQYQVINISAAIACQR
jgi:hypothetical protein